MMCTNQNSIMIRHANHPCQVVSNQLCRHAAGGLRLCLMRTLRKSRISCSQLVVPAAFSDYRGFLDDYDGRTDGKRAGKSEKERRRGGTLSVRCSIDQVVGARLARGRMSAVSGTCTYLWLGLEDYRLGNAQIC